MTVTPALKHKRVLTFCTLILVFLSCHHVSDENKLSDEEIKEKMTNVNKILVKEEAKDIDEFVSRHQWKMKTTGTGLRILIYEKGNGRQAALNDTVSIASKVYLLDGTLCYEAVETNPLKFVLGQGRQPGGLEEALQHMHQGDRARLVLPSHLAYGMSGDENKIPAGSALYYDIKLIKVN